MKRRTFVSVTPSGQQPIPFGNPTGKKLLRGTRNSLCLLLLAIMFAALATGLSSCKAWRTITTTATYSATPDKSGNPVTTIQTKTTEEYTGVKKN